MNNYLTTPAQAKEILGKLNKLGLFPTAVARQRNTLIDGNGDGPAILVKLESEPADALNQYGIIFEANPGEASTMLNLAVLRDTIMNNLNAPADLRWQNLFQQAYGSWDPKDFALFKANVGAVKAMTDTLAKSVLG